MKKVLLAVLYCLTILSGSAQENTTLVKSFPVFSQILKILKNNNTDSLWCYVNYGNSDSCQVYKFSSDSTLKLIFREVGTKINSTITFDKFDRMYLSTWSPTTGDRRLLRVNSDETISTIHSGTTEVMIIENHYLYYSVYNPQGRTDLWRYNTISGLDEFLWTGGTNYNVSAVYPVNGHIVFRTWGTGVSQQLLRYHPSTNLVDSLSNNIISNQLLSTVGGVLHFIDANFKWQIYDGYNTTYIAQMPINWSYNFYGQSDSDGYFVWVSTNGIYKWDGNGASTYSNPYPYNSQNWNGTKLWAAYSGIYNTWDIVGYNISSRTDTLNLLRIPMSIANFVVNNSSLYYVGNNTSGFQLRWYQLCRGSKVISTNSAVQYVNAQIIQSNQKTLKTTFYEADGTDLKPGFEFTAQPGKTFTAQPGDCPNQ